MTGLIDTLTSEAGKEIIKALVAGLGEIVKKKLPGLWRRTGDDSARHMSAELERTAAELADADGGDQIEERAAITWATRLRDLLAAHPEAGQELAAILAEIRRMNPPAPETVRQYVVASGQNSTSQGVVNGTINNYGTTDGPAASR